MRSPAAADRETSRPRRDHGLPLQFARGGIRSNLDAARIGADDDHVTGLVRPWARARARTRWVHGDAGCLSGAQPSPEARHHAPTEGRVRRTRHRIHHRGHELGAAGREPLVTHRDDVVRDRRVATRPRARARRGRGHGVGLGADGGRCQERDAPEPKPEER